MRYFDITNLDLSGGVDKVFTIDAGGWAPRTDVYAQALIYAIDAGTMLPSPQAVYAALRLRGFKERKIDGVYGFRGIMPVYGDRIVQNHHNKKIPPTLTPWFVIPSERL